VSRWKATGSLENDSRIDARRKMCPSSSGYCAAQKNAAVVCTMEAGAPASRIDCQWQTLTPQVESLVTWYLSPCLTTTAKSIFARRLLLSSPDSSHLLIFDGASARAALPDLIGVRAGDCRILRMQSRDAG
jgi:hypothetical protein